MKKGHF